MAKRKTKKKISSQCCTPDKTALIISGALILSAVLLIYYGQDSGTQYCLNMDLKTAMAIAQSGECGQNGTLASNAYCNNVTKTWWIDIDVFEPIEGCNPACVVDVETGQAEINWRCTGLIV